MQHDTRRAIDDRSWIAELSERFTTERSIKWVLGVGVVLMFGSSLMLVTSHWHGISTVSRFGIFLAYTGALWLAGEVTRRRAGQRRTSSVLLALTVLLLPLNFVALSYVKDGALFLLPVQLALSVPAASRIFGYFLRDRQPTFVAAYLILCLGGFLAPSPIVARCPHVAGLILWAVFAAGSVKVNRHVFWLGETARLPRIFAFFPVLLLATQFLTISLVYLAPEVELAWIGFASTLVAIPVLFTADAVARVFQERTGDLVRPIPWPILLPLVSGLLFAVAGLCLAATGLSPSAPTTARYALVPSALLLAIILGVLSARFRHTAFVWGALAAATLTYNFSPTYFIDLARAVLDLGARAVGEARLPYAFYGLTYLPLLTAGLAAAWFLQKRGTEFYARPLRQYAAGLSLLLLALAAGHGKALFPVAGVLTLVLLAAARLLGDRRLALIAAIAWIGVGAGLLPFVHVLSSHCGRCALCIAGSLAAPDLLSGVTLAAAVLWLASRKLDRSRPGGPARIFEEPSRRVAALILPLLTCCVHLPVLVYATFVPWEAHALFGLWPLACAAGVAWCVDAALREESRLLALLGGAGILAGSGALFSGVAVGDAHAWLPLVWTGAAVAMSGLLPLASRLRLAPATPTAAPCVWSPGPALSALVGLGEVVLVLVATLTSLVFTSPARLAAAVALGALWNSVAGRQRGPADSCRRSLLMAALNWQLISVAVSVLAPAARGVTDLAAHGLPASLPVAAIAGLSTLAWTIFDPHHAAPGCRDGLPGSAQRTFLRVALALGLWASLSLTRLGAVDISHACVAFGSLALGEFWCGCRRASERRGGTGLGVIAAALGYLAYFEVITFGHGLTMYLLVAGAFLLWALAAWTAGGERTSVLAPPFRRAAMVLPAAGVLWSIGRHLAVAPTWIGSSSLALFLAAGFYFWRGLEERRKTLVVLAGGIANIAFLLLWGDLELSDPQFYMIPLGLTVLGLIEVLKKEIPTSLLDPLRYLGALLILVSPTFHIVEGSWIHLSSLMVISVGVVLLSIAVRVRVLMYTGTAFLVADMAAMVVRGTVDHPSLLWLAGAGLGAVVLAIGALAENHRDELLGRIRRLSARLETWE